MEPAPEVVYRLMDTKADAREAIEQVLACARREVRVFDISPAALKEREFGNAARIERLREVLHASRANRLMIVMHEITAFESELPRLLSLMNQYSGQVSIYRTLGAARDAMDPMVIADDSHFWRKLYVDHPRSVITLHDAVATKPFLDRFEEIWQSAELALSGGTLGL